MDRNTLNRLLTQQAMADMPPVQIGQGVIGAPTQTIAQQGGLDDGERRQSEIAAREERRQQKARDKLANRQAQPERNETPMESDNAGADFNPSYSNDYDISDLVSGARGRAESRMGELDRKPINEWSRGDWGKLLVDIGGGFADAKDGQFSSGLSAASKGAAKHLKDLDDRAEKWNDRQRSRMDALDDLVMEDEMRRRRILDDRAYDREMRADDRAYRSGEKQQDRLYERELAGEQRKQRLEDRDEQRAYAEKVAAAANAREDAKELRAAASKSSRDYSTDYVKLATEITKAQIDQGYPPPSAEELDQIIIPQLRQAYGLGTLGGSTEANMLPEKRTLSSGY